MIISFIILCGFITVTYEIVLSNFAPVLFEKPGAKNTRWKTNKRKQQQETVAMDVQWLYVFTS